MLCVGTPCPALKADSIPDIVAHSKPAIIEVIAFDDQNRPLKTGTGFFITSSGVAVTNYHVIQGASSLAAMTNDGAFFAFEGLLYAPPGVDLALLKFSAHDTPWLKLGRSDTAAEGQRVLVIGNPTRVTRDRFGTGLLLHSDKITRSYRLQRQFRRDRVDHPFWTKPDWL